MVQAAQKTGAKVVILAADEVMGNSTLIKPVAVEMQKRGLLFGNIEFSKQLGSDGFSRLTNGELVRVHSVGADEISKASPATLVERYSLAVKERDMRVAYIRMIRQEKGDLTKAPDGTLITKDTALQQNLDFIQEIKTDLEKQPLPFAWLRPGMTMGTAQSFGNYPMVQLTAMTGSESAAKGLRYLGLFLAALGVVGATLERELLPGEFVRIDDGVVTTLAPLTPRRISRCIFELVYFSRPDSTIFGESVDHVRRELGRQLARFHPAPGADIVFSVPDSSNVMALGYSEVSGVKLEHGLIRNHYVGRTFINPVQALRVQKVKIKFNPVRHVIEGKSVCVVDDSLVRGTTSRGLVEMIRDAGAREVHLRLASPPITGPCHYGIDTPTREELIAATHSREEIRVHLGVDTLEYLTLDEMIDAAGRRNSWCHACFSGDYPTPVQLTLGAVHDAPQIPQEAAMAALV